MWTGGGGRPFRRLSGSARLVARISFSFADIFDGARIPVGNWTDPLAEPLKCESKLIY